MRPHLVLGLSGPGLAVAQEGDECGALGLLLVVVLGPVLVSQLDHPVVVGQLGVELPQTPGVTAEETGKRAAGEKGVASAFGP